jgi:hypothetical protein
VFEFVFPENENFFEVVFVGGFHSVSEILRHLSFEFVELVD